MGKDLEYLDRIQKKLNKLGFFEKLENLEKNQSLEKNSNSNEDFDKNNFKKSSIINFPNIEFICQKV